MMLPLLLILLLSSSATEGFRIVKKTEQRSCGIAFLTELSKHEPSAEDCEDLRSNDVRASWYIRRPRTTDKFSAYCCLYSCAAIHYKEFLCTTLHQ